ncbi:MAG: hypothetical protein GWP09_00495 [Nitrospiraceae bacterium]|nr:hypothetical protein [Nitrospiraceae bacterium]
MEDIQRNIIFLTMLFTIFAILVSGASAQVTSYTAGYPPYSSGFTIKVTLLNQEPDPCQPGSYVDLRFKVENVGLEEVDKLYVKLKEQYPFTVIDTNQRYVGNLWGMQEGNNGIIIKYKVMIDKDAYPGEVPITFEYSPDNKTWVSAGDFNIKIESLGMNVGISSVSTTPKTVEPGDKVKVDIKVKNLGDSLIKDASLKLDLTLESIPQSQTSQASTLSPLLVPFSPINSSMEKKVKTISPGQDEDFNFDLLVSPGAKSDVYKIPVVLTYYEVNGEQHTVTDLITITVGGRPKMKIFVEKPHYLLPDKKQEITVEIVNNGLLDAKFVSLRLKPDDGFTLLSSPYDYVGDIDSDDYETITFDVIPKKEGTLTLPVLLKYSDSLGQEYSDDINLDIKVYSVNEAKRLGIIETNKLVGLIIVLIILYVGWIVYKKSRNKRRK